MISSQEGRGGPPLARRALVAQVLTVVLALVLANVAVVWLARTSIPRQLLRAVDGAPAATDLFVGSSLTEAGTDERAFEAAWPGRRALNAGIGHTSVVEHYLVLLRAERHRPSALYYGFLDMRLTDSAENSFASIFGNRAMLYYVLPDTAAAYLYPHSPLRRAVFLALSHVPIVVERSAIWGRVEQLRRALGGVGLPKEETNEFGRASDFTLLEAQDVEEFRRQLRAAVDRRVPLQPAVRAMLRYSRARGARPYVVAMPMRARHRRLFNASPEWLEYEAHVRSLVESEGARYVNALDWQPDENFADPLHLNARGAAAFSTVIARAARAEADSAAAAARP